MTSITSAFTFLNCARAAAIAIALLSCPRMVSAQATPPCFANPNRYVNCMNGTVTDTVTGLSWLQRADCLGFVDYAKANEYAAQLKDGDCGLTDGSAPGDWRLPTKDEWAATVAPSCGYFWLYQNFTLKLTNDGGSDCILMGFWGGQTSFIGVGPGPYWSRSANVNAPGNAWLANLADGLLYHTPKANRMWAWPVRAH